jgi:hypothetical protein
VLNVRFVERHAVDVHNTTSDRYTFPWHPDDALHEDETRSRKSNRDNVSARSLPEDVTESVDSVQRVRLVRRKHAGAIRTNGNQHPFERDEGDRCEDEDAHGRAARVASKDDPPRE